MQKKRSSVPGYPYPIVLVGANVDGKANFMTAGWFSKVNGSPPMIAVSLAKGRATLKGIGQNGTFSINFASADQVEKVDYCGTASGNATDKSGVFKVSYGELGTAPMADESPACMECRMIQKVELPDHDLVIGEVVSSYVDEKCLIDGKPDTSKLNMIFLTDREYSVIGGQIAKAWNVGQRYKGN